MRSSVALILPIVLAVVLSGVAAGLATGGLTDGRSASVPTHQSELPGGTAPSTLVAPTDDIRQRWRVQTHGNVRSKAAVAGGTAYVGSEDGVLYAIDSSTGRVKWTFETDGKIVSSPTVANGKVYFGSTDNNLYAVDAETGIRAWSVQTNGPVTTAPVVVNGVVYVASEDNTVYARDAADGSERWTKSFERITSGVTVLDGQVYLAANPEPDENQNFDRGIVALDADSGARQWVSEFEGVDVTPAVEGGTVYAPVGNTLYALNGTDGSRKWSYRAGDRITAAPAVDGRTAYFGSRDNQVYAVRNGTLQWQYATESDVVASPTVVDDTVFVGSTDTTLYALDTADGGERWRVSLRDAIRSTPTVTDGRVFIGSDDGAIYAFDGASAHSTATVRIASDRVVIDPGQATVEGRIDAEGLSTSDAEGDLNTTDGTFSASGSSSITIEYNPGTLKSLVFDVSTGEADVIYTGRVIASGVDRFDREFDQRDAWPMGGHDPRRHGYNRNATAPKTDIQQQWRFQANGDFAAQPTVVDGVAYVGSESEYFYAIDVSTGRTLWSFETDGKITSPAAVVDGTVYFGSADNILYAVDAETGIQQWGVQTDGPIRHAPVVVDGTVYATSQDNTVYALDAFDGSERWTKSFEQISSGLAVSGDRVFLGADPEAGENRNPEAGLVALDADSGTREWVTSFGDVEATPTAVGGTVYAAVDRTLYALDAADGSRDWTYRTDGRIDDPAAVTDERVYVGSTEGTLYALTAYSGTASWTFQTSGDLTTPAVADDTVFVGTTAGTLHALATDDGASRWEFNTRDAIRGAPAVTDARVYVGSDDGAVYAIAGETGHAEASVRVGSDRVVLEPDDTTLQGTVDADGLAVVSAFGGQFDTETGRFTINGSVTVEYDPGTLRSLSLQVANGSTVDVFYRGAVLEPNVTAVERTFDQPGDWRMQGRTPHQSAFNPNTTAPTDVVTLDTRYDANTTVESPPAVVDGTVYVGNGNGEVFAFAGEGTERWRYEVPGSVVTTPAVGDDRVYVGGTNNTVTALDADTGTQMWTFQVDGAVRSPPVLKDGVVYVVTEADTVYAIDAASGSTAWSKEFERVFSGLAVAGDRVYLSADPEREPDENRNLEAGLVALDAESGFREWATELGDDHRVDDAPAVIDGVLVAAYDGVVYGFDADDGAREWSYDVDGTVAAPAAAADGLAYVGTTQNEVYAIDVWSGIARWSAQLDGAVRTRPVVADDTVFVGTERNTTHALAIADGAVRWEREVSATVTGTAAADGSLYVATRNGFVREFGGSVAGNEAPTAAFTFDPTSPTVGERVTFDASASNDSDGNVTGHAWDFDGDGTAEATGETANYTFETAGSHNVTLTVTDDDGSRSTRTETVTVEPSPEHTLGVTSSTVSVSEGQTTEIPIVLTNVVGGVGAFDNVTVSIDDTLVATLSGVSTNVSQDAQTWVAEDGSSVTARVSFGGNTADTGTVRILTVTARGLSQGTATLSVSLAGDVAAESGAVYTGVTTSNATIVVRSGPPPLPGFDSPPRNVDGDAPLEDTNGNGRFDIGDVQALFANRNSDAIQNNVDAFDFNNNGNIDIGDVQALFVEYNDG